MFGSVRRRRCKSVLRSASAACLLLGVFMVASPQSAEAGGGHKTRAQSSQVAHSARKKNEGAAAATSENRRVAQAQHARDARRQAEGIQKRARGDKLRKEAAAQKKITDDAAAAAIAKKQVADRKLKREEQTRKAKIEHERQLKLAAELKAAVEEEDRLRGVAEREAAVYEARRKEVAHIVEERQKLVATAKKLQQERQTRSISANRVGTTVPTTSESATAPLAATLDSSKGLRRDGAAGSSPGKDTAAPSGYCDRDGQCEGGEGGSGGSRVWLSDSGDVDAMQERLANEARERAAHNENAQKYLQAHQAQAAAKADERKRNEAAAAAMHSDRARAERQAAAHIAAAAATVAVKAAASESGKQRGGSTQELRSPTSKEQASALPTATADRGRRKPPSDKTGRKVREDAANKVRLLKAKEMFETAKKIASETIAAEKAEKAKAAKAAADVAIAAAAAAAAAAEQLCPRELPDFTELKCSSHSACGIVGYCTALHLCSDRRECTLSPGFPEANPVDSGCPPTDLAAYSMPCVTSTSSSKPEQHQGSGAHSDQTASIGTPTNNPTDFSIAALATAGQSNTGVASPDMVPGSSVRHVDVVLRDGNVEAISFSYIDGSQASWKPLTPATKPASPKVKVRDGVQRVLIAQDQHIVRIKAKVGSMLAGLQVVTSDGRTSPWLGGFDGKHKSFSAGPKGHEIWALHRDGSAGTSLLFTDVQTRALKPA